MLLGPRVICGLSQDNLIPDVSVRLHSVAKRWLPPSTRLGHVRCRWMSGSHPCGFLRHVSRREGSAGAVINGTSRSGNVSFRRSLRRGLLPVRTRCRALVGPAGSFFGRHMGHQRRGPLERASSRRVWCAYRRGHGEQPLVAYAGLEPTVTNDGVLDLFDDDDLPGPRGRAVGIAEVVHRADGVERAGRCLPT